MKKVERESQTEKNVIPEYLLGHELACSPEDYVGKSDRINRFIPLRNTQKRTLEVFKVLTEVPEVTALTHNLWQEWLANHYHFTKETETALRELISLRLQSSETGTLILRHAVAAPELTQSEGLSMTDLRTPEQVMEAIQEQYQNRVEKSWNTRDDVEVTLNLQEFTNPNSSFSFEYPEEDENAPVFHDGVPPIGGYVQTSEGGKKITIHYIYGDNRASQEKPHFTDIAHLTVVPPSEDGQEPLVRLNEVETHHKEYIHLDRKNHIVRKARLPIHMQSGRIDLSDNALIKIACFAHIATQELTPGTTTDVRIEFSLGTRGIYFNQINEREEDVGINPNDVQSNYKAVAVIASTSHLSEIETLSPDYSLPGSIILLGSTTDQTPSEFGALVEQIEAVISDRAEQALDPIQQAWWNNLVYFSEGSAASHRMNNALSRLKNKRLNLPFTLLPKIKVGDRLELSYRTETGTYWIKNNELAGDGLYIYALKHYADTPPIEAIGAKAFNISEYLKRLGYKTPSQYVFSRDAFFKTLEANNILSLWTVLPESRPEEIKNIFKQIHGGLKFIPPEIVNILTETIKKQTPDWETVQFIDRSDGLLEDQISVGGNWAGAFKSFPKLLLRKIASTVYSKAPISIEDGILEVIKSSFTPQLAKELSSITNPSKRIELFSRWIMPVLIMPHIPADYSGNIYRHNHYANRQDQIVIEAQRGAGGAVDDNDSRPRIRVIVNDSDVKCEHLIITLSENGHAERPISLQDAQNYLGVNFTRNHIMTLAASSVAVSQKKGVAQDIEFVTETNSGSIWWTQTRDLHR